MLKVGLTGGIACGKTTVLAMFAALGAYTLRADEVAHRLMSPGESVYESIVEHFGRDILNPDGTINRARLARKAFAGRIEELNALVHPPVIEAQEKWADEMGEVDPHAVAIIEAALMVEAGAHKHLDKLVVVTCREDQRAWRFAQRAGLSEAEAADEVARRMRSQLADAEKVKVADYIIDNSGSFAELEKQVKAVWDSLKGLELTASR